MSSVWDKNSPGNLPKVDEHSNQQASGITMFYIPGYGISLVVHDNKLREILARLRKYTLKLQPEKCEFLRKEVDYLGNITLESGVKSEPTKIKAIEEFPPPTNVKILKRFLGMAGYYSYLMPGFSWIASPYHQMLRKGGEYASTKDHDSIFRL
jgi:hypothetical protein